MRALSIRQPWAFLIVHGFKPVENRTWSTAYRGPLLIHASKTCTKKDYIAVLQQLDREFAHPPPIPPLADLERGGVVGAANLYDCVTVCDSPYFTGPFGFMLERRTVLPFVAHKGSLSMFDIPVATIPHAGQVALHEAGLLPETVHLFERPPT